MKTMRRVSPNTNSAKTVVGPTGKRHKKEKETKKTKGWPDGGRGQIDGPKN